MRSGRPTRTLPLHSGIPSQLMSLVGHSRRGHRSWLLAHVRIANAAIAASRVSAYPRAALARWTGRPGAASPIRRPWKRIRSAKPAEPPHLGQTLLFRGIAAVVADALPGIGRAPASAGPRRLAPLRARPAALGVSVGEQQSHYCDTEQNKTDRAHAVLPVHLFVRPIQNARVLASAPLPRRRTGLGTSRRLHPERCALCSASDAPPWRVLVSWQRRGYCYSLTRYQFFDPPGCFNRFVQARNAAGDRCSARF